MLALVRRRDEIHSFSSFAADIRKNWLSDDTAVRTFARLNWMTLDCHDTDADHWQQELFIMVVTAVDRHEGRRHRLRGEGDSALRAG